MGEVGRAVNGAVHTVSAVASKGANAGSVGLAFLIVALDHAASEVSRGENAGRHLTHVAVVRSLTKIGSVGQGQALSQDISLRLDPSTAESNLRVIAFLQEPGQARILGATEVKYPK